MKEFNENPNEDGWSPDPDMSYFSYYLIKNLEFLLDNINFIKDEKQLIAVQKLCKKICASTNSNLK